MKNYTLLLLFLSLTAAIHAQVIWNKKGFTLYPYENLVKLVQEDGQYQISAINEFYSFDQLGSSTGFIKREEPQFGNNMWLDVLKKTTAGTENPYFIFARRTLSLSGYNLVEYRPGVGYFHEQTFADSLGSLVSTQVRFVPLNDSIFLVFGKKYFRKIKFTQTGGFSEIWSKPLSKPIRDVILHSNNSEIVVSDVASRLYAMDTEGNELWSSSLWSSTCIREVDGGYAGCHQSTEPAILYKYSPTGTEIWSKITGDKQYSAVIGTFDGGIAALGTDYSNRIILVKYNGSGDEIWRKEYGPGKGWKLLATPDGGFLIAGNVGFSRSILIKTDANGMSAPSEEAELTQRKLKTATIEVTQHPGQYMLSDQYLEGLTSVQDSAYTMFYTIPLVGGKDAEGTVHFTESGEYNLYDHYIPGVAGSVASDFNRVWLAKRDEINRLRADFGPDHFFDQLIPFDLLTWPARGNPNLRFNLDYTPLAIDPDLLPAPFVDTNNDGIYNVYDGDYPAIKGDQMLWWALSDKVNHPESPEREFGIDLLLSAYAYECPQTELINHSIYVDVQGINRSETNYQDTYFGFLTDFSIGCPIDDYAGSLPQTNSIYAYNKTETDYPLCDGMTTFGNHVPVQSFTFLDRTLDYAMFPYSNIANPPIPNVIFPLSGEECYNILQGKWADGTPLTTGEIGYNPGSTDYTNHAFPDDPSDPDGWSMCTTDSLAALISTQMSINSHGPFDFAAGDTFRITLQFTMHFDVPHPCPHISGFVQPDLEQLQQWYDDDLINAAVDLGGVVNLPAEGTITLDAGNTGTDYFWSTGANTSTIQVAEPGVYSVSVTLPTGCQITDEVLVPLTTGITQPGLLSNWTIQPNPAHETVIIGCPDCKEGVLRAILRNAQGMIVHTSTGPKDSFRFEIREQPAGFYWLELWQDAQFMGSKKLVLNTH